MKITIESGNGIIADHEIIETIRGAVNKALLKDGICYTKGTYGPGDRAELEFYRCATFGNSGLGND